jgi:putative tryptophan/tyrosine transport system substrate-binding protein
MQHRSRRRFLQGSAALIGFGLLTGCVVPPAPTQQPTQAPPGERRARIGVLHLSTDPEPPVVIGLRRGLGELGYAEGQDLLLEVRSGSGQPEAARAAARELVNARVRVLVSAGTVATQAAQEAADDLPIIFTQVGDPVGAGFVQGLARPGGNLTGFSHLLPAATGKRLELLHELAPTARTVLTLYDPANPSSTAAADVARAAAEKRGLTLRERHVRSREEVSAALREAGRGGVEAILLLPDSLVVNAGDEIIEVAATERLPVMFHEDTWVRRGGLASYGASFADLGRQAASYVDKILKGATPSELPVQQATTFELVINRRTAHALGLTIPQTVLLQTAEVLE